MLAIVLLNALAHALALFLLASGLTLVFGLMGVLHFAHGAFFMLGAYAAFVASAQWGFGAGLLAAMAVPALAAWAFARGIWLKRDGAAASADAARAHQGEMLLTFGLAWLLTEAIALVFGAAPLDQRLPAGLEGALWTAGGLAFPKWRAGLMLHALVLGLLLWALLRGTRLGAMLRAAADQPQMLDALGHDPVALRAAVFAGGAALAGAAGLWSGLGYATEPQMGAALGPLAFVVVTLGGLGSVRGSAWAAAAVAGLQHGLLALDGWAGLQTAAWAPVAPYLALVAVLVLRPQGLAGASARALHRR